MNRILLAVVLTVAVVLGLGIYMGWFRITSERTDARFAVTFAVDWGRVQADQHQVRDQLPGAGNHEPKHAPEPAALPVPSAEDGGRGAEHRRDSGAAANTR